MSSKNPTESYILVRDVERLRCDQAVLQSKTLQLSSTVHPMPFAKALEYSAQQ